MTLSSGAAACGAILRTLLVHKQIRGQSCNDANADLPTIRRFARRSYIGQVAPAESFRIDQLVVGAAFAPAVLGYYTAATAFTNLARFLGGSIGHVLAPHIASLPAHQQRRSLLRGVVFTLAVCGSATAALLPSTDFLVPLLFGDAFRRAVRLAKVLLVAGFLLGVRRAVLPGLRGLGLPSVGSYAEVAAVSVFAACLPIALRHDSGIGVAIAFLASALVALIGLGALAHRALSRAVGGGDPPVPAPAGAGR